jgi:hypothetical protein
MGGGYLTQPFYHMAPRQTMPYSTSDFGFKILTSIFVISNRLPHAFCGTYGSPARFAQFPSIFGLEAEVGRRVLRGGGFAFGGHGKFRKSGKSWQKGWDNYRVTSKNFGKIIR